MTTTNDMFLVPTKTAVELRFKAELKRNPVFENMPSETKERFFLISRDLSNMFEMFDGMTQAGVNEIINSDPFWSAIGIALTDPKEHAPIVKAIRNIITDLCA